MSQHASRSTSTTSPANSRPVIRLAEPADGRFIARTIGADDWDGLDIEAWDNVGPSWLVATLDERPVGCVAIMLLPPLGHVDHLGVVPDLAQIDRARVVRALGYQAWSSLRYAGCVAAVSSVTHTLDSYLRVLERRGAKPINKATVVLKRLV